MARTDIAIEKGSMAIATGTVVTETETETETASTDIESGTGTGRETDTRPGVTTGAETMEPAVKGNSKTTGGTTIDVASLDAMKIVVVAIVGRAKKLHPFVVDEERKKPVPLKGDLPPQKDAFHCLSADARLQVGMSMLLDMSSILQCKQNKQVPPILGIPGLPPPIPVQTFGMGIGSNPNLSRQSRRLYIGSITPEVNEQNLAEFFNSKMIEMSIGTGGPGKPVLAVQCNYEKNYAFVEFRSAEDATAAMAFDGIIFINGPLKIRRPKDYGGPEQNSPGIHVPGVVSTNVPDSINKVFVGGLPTYLNEEQVQELLRSFGELKAFNLVRENGNGVSKGFAFFEYVDASVTDVAIQSLNGMELGDRYLVVQRASVGAKPGMPNLPYDQFPEIPRPIMPAGENSTADARILLMLNMVVPEDLVDDQEYGDIYEDVKDECSKYGVVEDLRIPRPVKKDKAKQTPGDLGFQSALDAQRADEAAGVGRVYVKFTRADEAQAGLKALAGRSFAGRSIIATVLNEDSQTTPPLNLIFAPQPAAPPPLPLS
ncbi:hypothetical protein EV401DRAFT_2181967 [Pisolithus croceorrhizus]|nr:hypothetical protein EV401DRAFT_2181967 [Pisolithus croceorrhizus]